MISKKLIVFLLLIGIILFIGYFSGIGSYFTLDEIKEHQRTFALFVHSHYFLSVLLYIAIFSILISCALPIIAPMTLLGGYLYGYFAILYAEAACLSGSIISFLIIRYVLAHWIKGWHSQKIDAFNEQIKKYGSSYLLILQFLSIIPLFIINLLAAITDVSFKTVVWTTIIGCFPLIFLLVYAGKELSTIQSVGDIFSPSVILVLVALALFALAPIFLKKLTKLFGI